MHLNIITENNDFIAVDKPSGLLSIPDRMGIEISAKKILQQKYGKIFTVHRLDKPTSGVLIFAKNEATHKILSTKFEGREMKKIYLALVNGHLLPEKGRIEAPIAEHFAQNGKMMVHTKGKPAITDYETVETFKKYTFVRYHIHTGRTHQIRVHTQYLGASVLCDELYGDAQPIRLSSLKRNFKHSTKEIEERPILSRLALHAWQLSFELNGTSYSLEAPLPKDLKALLQQMRKHDL